MLHDYIGWIGAFLFAICGLPQVIKTWKIKKADDLSWLFLIFWFLGEIFTLTYIILDDVILSITHYPLYINYVFNLIMVIYLIYAKNKYKS